MSEILTYLDELKKKSDERFDSFKIEPISSIKQIQDDAYLEKPVWLGGDQKFVCLFIDLDKSSKISFKKHPQTMAKIYDYFTQNIVDILNHPVFGADYIDIKGDGAFGIFEGEKASFKALYCAITFKTMFEKYIRDKFDVGEDHLSCKFGIHKDKLLVKKIGKRGNGNYNEVWAGRLVNNAAKLSNESKNIPLDPLNPVLPILVSKEVYEDFNLNKQYGFHHCCDGRGNPTQSKLEMFIRGENNNDLVWVGNATNYAVKLSSLSKDGYHVYISEDVYKNMAESSKLGGNEKKNMWEERTWTAMDNQTIYRTNWNWVIS